MKLTARELELITLFAAGIFVEVHHLGGETLVFSCNYCNAPGSEFSQDHLEAAMPLAINHLLSKHSNKVKPGVTPVTEEEIAEAFGLRHTKSSKV